jgi:hypothetical protein
VDSIDCVVCTPFWNPTNLLLLVSFEVKMRLRWKAINSFLIGVNNDLKDAVEELIFHGAKDA